MALLSLCLAATPARGAADDLIEQLATCRVSWLDWKNDPVQARKFGETINAAFTRQPRGPAWTPRKPIVIGGLTVIEAFPESVGMGVGFSLTVDANFDTARAAFEKLAGDNGKSKTTLLGCYYFYAQ